MSTTTQHPNVLKTPLDQLETLDYRSFRDRVVRHLTGTDRLVSLFGSPVANQSTPDLHAIFLSSQGQLIHFRGRGKAEKEFPSLTAQYSETHCFEREIHEQYGLEFPGHPWLKPIRFEGQGIEQMNDYPFYKLNGKVVHEVAVGPIHAGVIEPGHFRFMCYGEMVYHLEIHNGYQHRGVERLLLQTAPRHRPPLIESIAGDSAVAYALGHCRAWESLCGLTVGPEVEKLRAIGLELERIAIHLGGLSGMATDIAFLPGNTSYGRIRTTVINLSMRLCGSRFGRSWFRPGELRFDFQQSHRDDIRKSLTSVQTDIAFINKSLMDSKTVNHRLRGIGTVSEETAREIGLVGIIGRACGLARDLRTEIGGGAYAAQPIDLVTEPTGDCWARGMIRIREIENSLNWIMQAIDDIGDVFADKPPEATPQSRTGVVSLEEGWRGEIMHYVETDDGGNVSHYKMQDPSIRNWLGLAQSVKNNAIYDFPICNKSHDLSYCGTDL